MDFKATGAPQAKGYSDAGASRTKRSLKGFIASSGAPIEDIDFNNATLRQRGRLLYMAAPVASAAINTNRTKIVGRGLRMKSSIDRDILGISESAAKAWQKKTEAEWRMWAEQKDNCDALGMNNFYALQQLAVKSWLMSGDVFVLFKREEKTPLNPYTLRLHIVEADRISTPNKYGSGTLDITEGKNYETGNKIHDGVEVDSSGRVVAYHVCNSYRNDYLRTTNVEWERVAAHGEKTGLPNILQIMDAERPDQYRGVTYLAPVIEVMLQLRRYTESELIAALVQSYFTAWITTQADVTEMPFNEIEADNGGAQGEPDSISNSSDEYEMGPGGVYTLKEGENVTFGNPKIPTAGFEVFVKSICKLAGASLELPYDVLIKEFNSSYSAAKGALEEAWEMFKMRRAWFINDFCQPTYETWLAEAVATGRIKAPGFFENPLIRAAWCGARWDGPAQTHLDPVKEAKANTILVSHGWKTNEQVTREFYGENWEENAAAIEQEKKMMPSAFAAETQQDEPEQVTEGVDENA